MSGSFSYERYDSRPRPVGHRRTVFGFWVPITITMTLAAGGLAAWVFRSREDHETTSVSSDDENLSYGADDTDPIVPKPPGQSVSGQDVSEGVERRDEDTTIVGRVQGIMRRTPSPQQVLDGAKKGVVAGVAAVGGMVGGALGSIREDREDGAFQDHERWRREESTTSNAAAGSGRDVLSGGKKGVAPGGKRRTVAIIISAEEGDVRSLEEEEDDGWKSEHASLLSHIPPVNLATTNLVILVFAPRHQAQVSESTSVNNPKAPSSLGSSYGAIPTPSEELTSVEPMPVTPALSARSSGSSFYDMIYKQALRLVSSPENIMPFSTPGGFTHMIKHLGPDVVYVSEALSGKDGSNVLAIKGWVGQVVVVVGGDAAGLVETEDEMGGHDNKWWEGSDMVGLGKGVELVDAIRVGDDWERRVAGKQ